MKRALTMLFLVGCSAAEPSSDAAPAPASAAPRGSLSFTVAPSPTQGTSEPRRGVEVGPLAEPPAFAGVPVLLFHEICPTTCTSADTYGISRTELDGMLAAFAGAGYTSISMADAARAHRGDLAGLPRKPILLTFDDSREDAYVGADDVLANRGFRATMFVITHNVSTTAHYMTWTQVAAAASSGHWDLQLHAGAGHVLVRVRPPSEANDAGAPLLAPFYANRLCADEDCETLESFADWTSRTTTDIASGEATLTDLLGDGYASHSFAVPYGDYGQGHSNDARIAPALRAFLDAHYEVWFTQPSSDPPFLMPATAHDVARYTVLDASKATDVMAWLSRHESH